MSLYNSFDKNNHLSELGEPLETQGAGVLTAAQRRLLALRNLTGNSSVVLADIGWIAGITAGTGAASKAVVLDSGEDFVWPATGILTYGVLKDPAGTTLGATAAEINAAADVSARSVVIPDATPYTVLVANSGKVHVIAEQTANLTLNLPTAAAGLEYEFIMGGVATEAQNWIFAAGVPYKGGLGFADLDAGAGADEINNGVYPNGSSNDNMTIVTPAAGTRVKVVCDGTNWFVNGLVVSATIPSFAD